MERTSNDWWKDIPVAVNNAFGDSLTDLQIEDTCEKLNSLADQGTVL